MKKVKYFGITASIILSTALFSCSNSNQNAAPTSNDPNETGNSVGLDQPKTDTSSEAHNHTDNGSDANTVKNEATNETKGVSDAHTQGNDKKTTDKTSKDNSYEQYKK